MSKELMDFVNKQVANWTVLYMKLHHFHWYVKGSHFFILHEKFEEFYNQAHEYVDELAERMLALGSNPVSTLEGCLKLASIQEAKGNESGKEMVEETISDFEKIAAELDEGIELAGKAGDDGTQDIFIGMGNDLKKHIWMLRALIQ